MLNRYKVLYLILFCIMFAGLYYEYLIGAKDYVFLSPNSDYLINYFSYKFFLIKFKKLLDFSGFILSFGLGANIFTVKNIILDPFRILFAILSTNIIRFEIYNYFLKMLIIYILSFKILKLRSISLLMCGVFALIFSFNGMFVFWSSQDSSFTAMVFIILQWYGYEKLRQSNKVFYFVICALPLFMLSSVYWVVIGNMFFALFILFDILPDATLSRQKKSELIKKIILSFIIVLFLSAWSILPELWVLKNNPRVGGNSVKYLLMDLSNLNIYCQFILRGFGGYVIPFEKICISRFSGPLWYSSILLPISTLAFIFEKWRSSAKVRFASYFVVLAFCFLPIVVLLFNGFSHETFRFSWLLLLPMLICSAKYWQSKYAQSTPNYRLFRLSIALTSILFIAACSYEYKIGELLFETWQIKVTYLVLIILAVLFFSFSFLKGKKTIVLISILALFEVMFHSWMFIHNAVPIDANYKENHLYYYDDTTKAIHYIKKNDGDSFYRVDKNFSSLNLCPYCGLNENLVQGYSGVKQYQSTSNPAYFKFNLDMDAKPYYNFIFGFDGRYDVLRMLGVKYILSKTNSNINGYKLSTKINDIFIYKGNTFNGIGKIFHNGISKSEFMKLDTATKDKIFSRCLITNNIQSEAYIKTLDSDDCLMQDRVLYNNQEVFKVSEVEGGNIIGSTNSLTDGVLFIAVPYDSGFSVSVDGVSKPVLNVGDGFIGLNLIKGKHEIKFSYMPPWFMFGFISSIVGVLFIMLIILRKKVCLK